ncbi:MAG: TrpR-like protein, YerC/YecD [Clostridia bacterium]|nr:TrpR-like protein, YerC/YecD [Clostridia bacterium]
MGHLQNEGTDRLFRVLLKLTSLEECYDLFEDLCTIKELQDMAQRLEVAFLLDEGKKYQEIMDRTSVSSATISRINKCLLYGSGGYRRAIDREKAGEQA